MKKKVRKERIATDEIQFGLTSSSAYMEIENCGEKLSNLIRSVSDCFNSGFIQLWLCSGNCSSDWISSLTSTHSLRCVNLSCSRHGHEMKSKRLLFAWPVTQWLGLLAQPHKTLQVLFDFKRDRETKSISSFSLSSLFAGAIRKEMKKMYFCIARDTERVAARCFLALNS